MSSSAAAPLGRQLTSLVDRKRSHGDVAITSILGEICREASTSTSELHKFSLRINSLLHANQDVAKGLTLALKYVESVPWDEVVLSAAQWISAALTHFSLAKKESIPLLNQLLGRDAASRLEYWRNVASTSVSKYATVLIEAAEGDSDNDDETMIYILDALSSQIRLYPSSYRSQAAQVQQICSRLLAQRPTFATQSSIVLAALHRTGKGSTVQTQLWIATLELLLKDAQIALFSCTSCFNATETGKNGERGLLPPLPEDSIQALEEGYSRLRLILGSPPSAGVISTFLSEPTLHAVPLPLDRLVNLALSILSTSASSMLRQNPAPEATLLASQSALLPSIHITALTFLATLPIGISFAKARKVVNRILRIIETSSAPVRCVAFNALLVLNLKLDPENPTLLRCARTCLAQIARLLKYTTTPAESSTEANGNKERSKKRRKVFESDQVRFTKRNGFTDLNQDEYAGCIAAVKLLAIIYEALATHLSAEHRDLAQTSALILLGLAEISLQDPDALSESCLASIAQVIRLSRGSVLALMTTRSSALASQGAQSSHYDTKMAAELVLQALEFTFHPRLPFKLDLRLHVDNDGVQGNTEEEPILGKVELQEDRGAQEVEALKDVLQVEGEIANPVADQNGSMSFINAESNAPLPESPQRSTPRQSLQLSPDPVKPLYRPNTPRIGSPSLSHAVPLSNSTTGLTTSADNGTIIGSADHDRSQQPLFASVAPIKATSAASASGNRVSISNTASPPSPLAQGEHSDRMMDMEDSDDEPLPEIDLRSSDEEDEDDNGILEGDDLMKT